MANKKQIKKPKLRNNLNSIVLCVLSILVVVLILSIYFVYKELRTVQEQIGKKDISYFIVEAINNLTKEAPTASYTNSQFIDEMKLKFTSINSTNLAYTYSQAEAEINEQEYLTLTSTQLKNSAEVHLAMQLTVEDVLNAVPSAQACSRLFTLSLSPNNSVFYENYSVVYEKTLIDGRIIYIHKENGITCNDNDDQTEDLLETLKTVQSY